MDRNGGGLCGAECHYPDSSKGVVDGDKLAGQKP